MRGSAARRAVALPAVAVAVLTLAACGGGADGEDPTGPTTTSGTPGATWAPGDPANYATDLVTRTNAARDDEGLPALAGSACAQAAAQQRAADLVGAAGLTHAPLTGTIETCAPSTVAAENLSRAAAAPGDVVAAWLGSPGHRSNLLDPDLTEIGIGCVLDDGEMLCSQVFLGP